MLVRYTVISTADAWRVSENGQAISLEMSRFDALELANLLALATKAAGGEAAIMVEDADQRLVCWNIDRPSPST